MKDWYSEKAKCLAQRQQDINALKLSIYEGLRDFSQTNKYALPIWMYTPKNTLADIIVEQHMKKYGTKKEA